MADRTSVDPQLAVALKEVMTLQKALNKAIDRGDDDTVEDLLAELTVVERQRNRLLQRAVPDTPTYSTVRSLRDQVIGPLQLLGRPASLGLIADLSKARWGDPIPTRRLASVRRDEQSSYESRPGGRPEYIAPALSADRFSVIRSVLSLSSWPLELRIAGPTSPRVDLLVGLSRLTDQLDTARSTEADWAAALERLIARLARTVPAALSGAEPKAVDTALVRTACTAELAAIEHGDTAARVDAAERAKRQLSEQQQIFGVRIGVITGGRAAGGKF